MSRANLTLIVNNDAHPTFAASIPSYACTIDAADLEALCALVGCVSDAAFIWNEQTGELTLFAPAALEI